MMRSEINERCRLIQGSFHESKVPSLPENWREQLFTKPAPKGWRPKKGDFVYLRPGITIGGLLPVKALVTDFIQGRVGVRIQNIRRWKSRMVDLKDVRPV